MNKTTLAHSVQVYLHAQWPHQLVSDGLPLPLLYTPMYMLWVMFRVLGISQRQSPSAPPLLRCSCTTLAPLVLQRSHILCELETRVPLGKNQFPKTRPVSAFLQQLRWSVMQSRASSRSRMSSRVMTLLFWQVVPLSENQMSAAPPGKEGRTNVTVCVNQCYTCCCYSTPTAAQNFLKLKRSIPVLTV